MRDVEPQAAQGPATGDVARISHYRPEIDGLRAVAVAMVILYHSDFKSEGRELFSGGFVGVDIFFVISGYLIGSLLMRELAAGSFSFATFYERRMRRILPALFTVMLVCIPFAWAWMLPRALVDYGGSMVTAVLSVSNIFFWLGDSYDAEASLFKPNIHTWSLGIEEQFYLLFPILLLAVWRFLPRRLTGVIVVVALLSLGFAEWQTDTSPDASFYLLPARVWELAVGVLLARLETTHGRTVHPVAGQIAPLIGLAMIVAMLPLMQNHVHHPGVWTVVPITGAALVIWFSGGRDVATRLLAARPMVLLGLLSYSLYLWHQPIFAFARIRSGDAAGLDEKLAWIALSLGLAVLTYRFIERPMRDRRLTSTRFVAAFSVVAAALLIGFGVLTSVTVGIPSRFPTSLAPILAAEVIPDALIRQNGILCLNYNPRTGPCVFKGRNPTGYSLLTVGDSHTRTLTDPLLDVLDRQSNLASFTPLNMGRCPFVIGIERVDGASRACPSSFNAQRLSYIMQQPRPLVITGSRLPFVLEGERFDNREGGVEPGGGEPRFVRPGATWDRPASTATIRDAFKATIGALLARNVKVVLVYPVPAIGWNVPRKLMSEVRDAGIENAARVMRSNKVSVSRALFAERARRSYAIYDSIPDHPNLIRIYPEKLFCRADRCMAHDDRAVFYRDDNHLSDAGGERLRDAILQAVEERWPIRRDRTRTAWPLSSSADLQMPRGLPGSARRAQNE